MYHSTRGTKTITASKAIINGLASDGGLYIKDLKAIDLKSFIGLSYKETAKKIMAVMIDDFSEADIDLCIEMAYSKGFDSEELVNIKTFEKYGFLELYHGPTLAFKDMALTILPKFLMKAKEINNIKEKTVILTATSGDTGAAALNGFKDVDNCNIIVFYPNNGVSDVQERQMQSYHGSNANVIALNGNFDDCQNFVKRIFSDLEIQKKLSEINSALSSANSINIGRLIPQIVYYFYSYFQLVDRKIIKFNDEINFSVPTGNFGDILAGYYAKKLGLPINKLICASNKNKILTDFLETGVYDINRDFYKTNAPSMDILISSNLERLLYELCENDPNKVNELMMDLKNKKKYELSLNIKDFYGNYATEDETLQSIEKEFVKNKYLMDTHTAIAYKVYEDYIGEVSDNTYTLIVSTACPYKFAPSVSKALGLKEDTEFNQINELHKLSQIDIHPSLEKLKSIELKPIVWNLDEAYDNLLELLGIK